MGDHHDRPLGAAQAVDAVGDGPERVDVEPGIGLVENREPGLEHRHLEDLVALLLAAGEAEIDASLQELLLDPDQLGLVAHELHEARGVDLLLTPRPAQRIERGAQEVHVGDAWDLHGVLEGQKHAGGRALLRRHRQQVLAVIADLAAGHLVAFPAGEDVGERALARAVGAHDGVDLAGADLQVDASQNLLVVDRDAQVLDPQHTFLKPVLVGLGREAGGRVGGPRPAQPTLPSRLIASSFCASTANSIGSSCITSLQKPLTINATASSSDSPRCRQ